MATCRIRVPEILGSNPSVPIIEIKRLNNMEKIIFILLLILVVEIGLTAFLLSKENISENSVLVEKGELLNNTFTPLESENFQNSTGNNLLENSLKNLEIKLLSDKSVYHSGDVLNLDFKIITDDNYSNVKVVVDGIFGRLNQEKLLNLKKGENNIAFNYTLPRCNVCGGISEGEYTIIGKIIVGEKSKETSTKITIMQ